MRSTARVCLFWHCAKVRNRKIPILHHNRVHSTENPLINWNGQFGHRLFRLARQPSDWWKKVVAPNGSNDIRHSISALVEDCCPCVVDKVMCTVSREIIDRNAFVLITRRVVHEGSIATSSKIQFWRNDFLVWYIKSFFYVTIYHVIWFAETVVRNPLWRMCSVRSHFPRIFPKCRSLLSSVW